MTKIYGIANCDTIKKTKKWLDNQHIDYRFHDFRRDGLERCTLERWCSALGWESLLNRRGTTWRKLPEALREAVDEVTAIELMLEQPSLIKRPVLEINGTVHVGFSESGYTEIFHIND